MATIKIGLLFLTNDFTSNKMAHKMLQSCIYKELCVGKAMDAMKALLEVNDTMDFVLTNFHTLEGVGSQILDHIHHALGARILEMIPEWNNAQWKENETKAASYILIDPYIDVIHKIWHEEMEAMSIEKHKYNEVQTYENDMDKVQVHSEDGEGGKEGGQSNAKNIRFIWTPQMHQKFLDALETLGRDRIHPKRILRAMNVPSLTRANVASHLQKYRLSLKKAQEEELRNTMYTPWYKVAGTYVHCYDPHSSGGVHSTVSGYPGVSNMMIGSSTPVPAGFMQLHYPNVSSPLTANHFDAVQLLGSGSAPPLQQFQQDHIISVPLQQFEDSLLQYQHPSNNHVISQEYYQTLVGGSIHDQSSVHLPPPPVPVSGQQLVNTENLTSSLDIIPPGFGVSAQNLTAEIAPLDDEEQLHMYDDDLGFTLLLDDVAKAFPQLFGYDHDHHHIS